MRTCSFGLSLTVVLIWMAVSRSTGCACVTQTPSHSTSSEDSLRTFLRRYAIDNNLEEDKTAQYFPAFVDLNGDGKKEAVVYLRGRWWCGTGGCPTLILTADAGSYRIVTRISITRPPIRLFTRRSNGWLNIGAWVQGGGIQPGYEAELRFDGNTYPENPSTPPAGKAAPNTPGKVIIQSLERGVPLYP